SVGFASIRDAARAVAIGRATIDDGWLGVTAVEVEPALRRSGLATAIMAALLDWGRERGTTRSYLQVSTDNDPAVTLYTRMGYWVHHDDRDRPEPEQGDRPDASQTTGQQKVARHLLRGLLARPGVPARSRRAAEARRDRTAQRGVDHPGRR